MTIYQLLYYFAIYAFLGWILEVAFHGAIVGKVINRGFLNGPFCPIYGVGMIAMPKQYAKIDFRVLSSLKDTYPQVYIRLNEHLENDWEPIIKLINEGIRKKEIRKINTFILRKIITATFEQLLSTDELQERNLTYAKALKEMMNIIMKGMVIDNE